MFDRFSSFSLAFVIHTENSRALTMGLDDSDRSFDLQLLLIDFLVEVLSSKKDHLDSFFFQSNDRQIDGKTTIDLCLSKHT